MSECLICTLVLKRVLSLQLHAHGLVNQTTKRSFRTFARYFDTTLGALATISASASNCLDVYHHSYISRLLSRGHIRY